jgi:lysophospholipase L1-like esterase
MALLVGPYYSKPFALRSVCDSEVRELQPMTSHSNTGRPAQPEPFLRGCAYPAWQEVPYPRASLAPPGDRLPADTRAQASLPVSVRFELRGSARALAIDCEVVGGDLGLRGEGAGVCFSVFRGGRCVSESRVRPGRQRVTLSLGEGFDPGERAIVYLPEGMKPLVHARIAIEGEIAPAPAQPRWLCYGDSIAEGWVASGPAWAWPAIAGREQGLDVANLGYAGAARGELVSAEHIAALPADVISISHGTNCWSRIATSADAMRTGLRDFLSIVREGHPETPIVCVSPLLRPQAEATRNRLGATHADLRASFDASVRERIAGGDRRLTLIEGAGLVSPAQLPDGLHPDDAGHRAMAAAIGPEVAARVSHSR